MTPQAMLADSVLAEIGCLPAMELQDVRDHLQVRSVWCRVVLCVKGRPGWRCVPVLVFMIVLCRGAVIPPRTVPNYIPLGEARDASA